MGASEDEDDVSFMGKTQDLRSPGRNKKAGKTGLNSTFMNSPSGITNKKSVPASVLAAIKSQSPRSPASSKNRLKTPTKAE